ncbi:molybdopterin synthase sulfur carrier subunit [Flavobacterium sp. L1I52]|uniref:Molybdopterin synthase sulfur carrier subunit n=1 Tax=Flavobacterium pokkalii TaxID=1940408 RepID=A0ABR7URF9_9FLAO|nr:MoaD/ThiS family protein [Flavobacterium pokkalii]KQB41922.1 Sulfur transfer protein ThiS [Flavobacterium daejeonense]MBD0725491.1 molybdopterin synthase sulfur carrier subunit [Flavobacterium pokkalii]
MLSVKYFGAVAEKTNIQGENIPFANLSLQELVDELEQKYDLASLSYSIAVNQKMVQDKNSYMLMTNDVVALLPPFAGG